jgi:hypothetical protein
MYRWAHVPCGGSAHARSREESHATPLSERRMRRSAEPHMCGSEAGSPSAKANCDVWESPTASRWNAIET